jgi:hypothetical protein
VVIETVVTTLEASGEVNFAAMGVVWGEETIRIRPFRNTRTFRNLGRTGEAVVNVTDNVLVFAQSALSRETFPTRPAHHVRGAILAGACRWREVRVADASADRPGPGEPSLAPGRAEIVTRVVGGGELRPFAGLCRAKHAVVEASILASRLRFLPLDMVLAELERLGELVRKTGDDDDHAAMDFIRAHVARRAAGTAGAGPAPAVSLPAAEGRP